MRSVGKTMLSVCRTRFVALIVLPWLLGADWPEFRGPLGNGSAEGPAPPLKFSPDDKGGGENVAWRADLTGRGPASPIVVGGRVLVASSSGVKQDRIHLAAFAVASGKALWERQIWATGRTLTHPQTSTAAQTPASDGKHVLLFTSANDLACFDLDGNLLWYRGLGHDWPKAGNDIGMSASPVISGRTVIVQIDNQGDSFAAGIDIESGETRWRLTRDPIASWCSPAVVRGKTPAEDIVVLQHGPGLDGIDPATGEKLWQQSGRCEDIPSCATSGRRLFAPMGGITAFDLGEKKSDPPKQVFSTNKLQPGAACPLVFGGGVYTLNRAGVLNCGHVQSGAIQWQLRLKGPFWASPAAVGGYLYAVNYEGLAQVVKLVESGGEQVGGGDFHEQIQASPVIADGAVYFRSDKHLWKIAAP